MRILDFLKKENCVPALSSQDKEEVLRELCDILVKNGEVKDGDAIYEAVINREKLGSTGIGDHVAIPHAKSVGVDSLVAAFGVSKKGIEYYAVDDKPVRLVFLLLASENSTGAHLKALARVSRLLRNKAVCEKLRGTDQSDALYALLTEATAHQAA